MREQAGVAVSSLATSSNTRANKHKLDDFPLCIIGNKRKQAMSPKGKKRNFTECEVETLVNEVKGVKNYYFRHSVNCKL